MREARAEFYNQYISVTDFLLYIAFTQKETVGDVASWLLYNAFSEDIHSYEIDRHYRTYRGDKKYGMDKNIEKLFQQITFDGYHAYYAYESYLEDKKDGLDTAYWEENFIDEKHYKPVLSHFFFKIHSLYKLDYIRNLNLDLKKAKNYWFRIYSCDHIDANLRKKHLVDVTGVSWYGWTLKHSKKTRKEITPEQKEKNRQQLRIIEENVRKAIEWAASEASHTIEDKVTKDPKHEIELEKKFITESEYQNLTPIEKSTYYLKGIALPLSKKIWQFDKQTNLLMRIQVAELIVELLPDYKLTARQVDKWLKDSNEVPPEIINRCAKNNYGITTAEKEKREEIKQKIRKEIPPEIQFLIKNAPKF